MRILLIGNQGQLGRELERELGGDLTAVDLPVLDLTDEAGLRRAIRGETEGGKGRYDLIVNAAAYTAVDRAESEPERAMAANGRAPGILAEEARRSGAAFIHYSTDYVFDGEKGSPYVETDAPTPLGVYGESKLRGEREVERAGGAFLILRTAWVYSLGSDSFVTKVLRWAGEQETLKIVSDQVSSPTWARSLARATARVVRTAGSAGGGGEKTDARAAVRWLEARAGLYHLAGDGYASRLEWAEEILSLLRGRGGSRPVRAREIVAARTSDFPAPARRPLFSALDCGKFERTFGFKLEPWREALATALADLSPWSK